ncbi:hypothetical protein ACFRR7_32940 [Streptomyces sp. NPDC056909]|uniref:hypothetical protein n=1 Tax=Streptomyces sp. NPDC056909 TaxID=3345963 RepID=UPI0036868843
MKFMPGTRDGLMVNGGGFQGKTETACSAAAIFEGLWRAVHRQVLPDQLQLQGTRDVFVPVAYCRLPVRATSKALCKTILDIYGDPTPRTWTTSSPRFATPSGGIATPPPCSSRM